MKEGREAITMDVDARYKPCWHVGVQQASALQCTTVKNRQNYALYTIYKRITGLHEPSNRATSEKDE